MLIFSAGNLAEKIYVVWELIFLLFFISLIIPPNLTILQKTRIVLALILLGVSVVVPFGIYLSNGFPAIKMYLAGFILRFFYALGACCSLIFISDVEPV